MKWIIVGFFLSISYKSVLRAMMIKIDYEKTVDTIDDMLQSEIPIKLASDTHIFKLLETDNRKKVISLKEKIEFYLQGTKSPDWIASG